MKSEFVLIIPEPVRWFSQLDEDCFFGWLRQIEVVKDLLHVEEGLKITFYRKIDKSSLYDLIALMTRYGLEMKCLRPLCDSVDIDYFGAKEKYWHDAIYG